jgi:hypothetical protein
MKKTPPRKTRRNRKTPEAEAGGIKGKQEEGQAG